MKEIELPWTEKYRPRKLDSNIVGHDDIVKRLKVYAKEKSMPNLMFTGPAGNGKTTCAVALGYELFDSTFGQNFLELNASDERGIGIIRGKIKDFAATLPYGDARFKIIFLDEADSLTNDAQAALRRTMENYARTCRFVMSCNYSSRIIEPIQSRCAILRFKPLTEKEITSRLKEIAKDEKVNATEKAFEALVYASEGDMRKAINFLQMSSTLKEKIDEEDIYKIAAKARPKEIKDLITLALKGEFEKARKELDALMFDYGMSGEDVINQIYREVINSEMDDHKKISLIDRIGEHSFRITEGANERIQLESLIAYLILLGKK